MNTVPDDPRKKSPSLKQEAPGSHLGASAAGGLLIDGAHPIEDLNFLNHHRSVSGFDNRRVSE